MHFYGGATEGALDQNFAGIGLYLDNKVTANQSIRLQLSSFALVGAESAYTGLSPSAVLKYSLGGGWGFNVSGGPDFDVSGAGEVNIKTGMEATKHLFKTDFVKGRAGFEWLARDATDGPDIFSLYLGMSVTPPVK